MPLARLFRGVAAAVMTALATPAAAGAIDEFTLPAGTQPGGITAGSDDALWFVEEGPSAIGRITTGGAVTDHFAVNAAAAPPDVSALDQITLGPDGNLWFTQPADDQIGRMTIPGGAVTEYNVPNADNEPEGITVGPDGAIWFTAAGVDKIGRIPVPPQATSTGGITMFPSSGEAGQGVGDITAGPDGALWFTEGDGNRIGRITTGGVITHPGTLVGSQRAVGHHRRSGREALVRRGAGRSDRRDHHGRANQQIPRCRRRPIRAGGRPGRGALVHRLESRRGSDRQDHDRGRDHGPLPGPDRER